MANEKMGPGDERWLQVLAGRLEAENEDERKAAALRGYIERRTTRELDSPADPEREKRLLNLLQASGVLDAKRGEARPPAEKAGPLSRLLDWLSPSGGLGAGRLALVATVTLAILAVPVLQGVLEQRDETSSYKSAPITTQEVSILALDPEQEARQLAQMLARYGVSADIVADGDARVLHAQVPGAALDDVRSALAEQGIPSPADGQLAIRIRPLE